MKSTGTQYWISPNTGATNSSGWSGLPGGHRTGGGTFNFVGNFGFWWSSTESSATNAWTRTLYYGLGAVSRNGNDRAFAWSVRCLKD